MATAQRRRVASWKAAPGIVAVASAIGMTPAAATQPGSVSCEALPSGEINVEAHAAPVGSVLRAIAAESGFDLAMVPGTGRAPVTVSFDDAAVGDVVHALLQQRNYALFYGGDGEIDGLLVLETPDPRRRVSRPATPPRRASAPRHTRGAQNRKGPVVVVVR